jgi:hypothetical protein
MRRRTMYFSEVDVGNVLPDDVYTVRAWFYRRCSCRCGHMGTDAAPRQDRPDIDVERHGDKGPQYSDRAFLQHIPPETDTV